MDESFEELKKVGKNNVESIIRWMKDAKIIDESADVKAKARELFKDVSNHQDVELAKFKEVLGKLATDQDINLDELTKTLATEGPKLLEALAAGAAKYKELQPKK